MAERRTKLSHPDGQMLSDLANEYAQLANPQLFFNIQDAQTDSPEWKAYIKELENKFADALEGGHFRDEFPDLF